MKGRAPFFAAPPEPVAGPQDVGQFDVVTRTSAGGGGFYVAHTMWAVLVEVPFSLVELPYTLTLFLFTSCRLMANHNIRSSELLLGQSI
ncbi:hypothetical protein SAMN05192532_101242 [Alteribacillus iranensis]|uniref:Uncharacterized protein n=1 Tax=Alteribacillus iranensis TaxID=930128 RepID=A0A1I1ZH27_9BACI|nr:hypothetical protein SAMN05192532_101242 [Alteribacillus iranensis]